MDEEILDMIEDLTDEVISLVEENEKDMKKRLRALLERKMQWVINYTHNVDAL